MRQAPSGRASGGRAASGAKALECSFLVRWGARWLAGSKKADRLGVGRTSAKWRVPYVCRPHIVDLAGITWRAVHCSPGEASRRGRSRKRDRAANWVGVCVWRIGWGARRTSGSGRPNLFLLYGRRRAKQISDRVAWLIANRLACEIE